MTLFSQYRRTLWAKGAAVGFICLIVLGNIWLSYAVIAHQPPPWLMDAFVFGAWYMVGQSIGFGYYALSSQWQSSEPPDDGEDRDDQA